MGLAMSYAAAPPPPPPTHSQTPVGLGVVLPPKTEEKVVKKVDFRNLPCPLPFEEIQREALMSLKPELFEGLRFDFTKGLNQKFSLNFRTQFQIGNNAFYGGNYIQSVTPNLSLGGEVFWLGHQRKSGIGFAARYNTDKMVATGQVASTGVVALSYVQKVSEKVSFASDLMYNQMTRDVTASFGYDYILRQCRLRGKIDSNGVVSSFLEERLNMGVNFILSAEVDHRKKDYKFGFGMTVGE
ncbi:hypothetical protein KFK09_000948 [Dendrobium nobile]|uniref:Mitochondrial import receptor subunit TOM40-1 n=1 Tax=Dendrobium nobile TaxID=94219 RepID=A0A8T3C9X1_DENNO|nr:hypothetical protein KFK09_000948 [Dendrobium nobile]